MRNPWDAEEIAETLGVARSNVSTSLKELQGWGIVKVVHVMGDRRDHFESVKDVWSLFQIIMDERKKREIDPTLAVLKECVAASKGEGDEPAHAAAGGIDGVCGEHVRIGMCRCGGCRRVRGSSLRRWGMVSKLLGK